MPAVARLLSLLFQPLLTGAYLLIALFLGDCPPSRDAFSWLMVCLLLTVGVPAADLARRLRKGTISDFQLAVREQRPRVLLVAQASTGACLLLLVLMDGPLYLLLALTVAFACGLVLVPVTTRWKISFHSATLASAVVLVTWRFGVAGLWLIPLLIAVGWSRVALRRHTPAQVLAGAVVAAAIAGAVVWTTGA